MAVKELINYMILLRNELPYFYLFGKQHNMVVKSSPAISTILNNGA